MRGKSLVPYLAGTPTRFTTTVTGTGWELFGRRAIRQGDWKALYLPAYGTGKWQLYDLSADPGEIEDMAEARPEKLTELLACGTAMSRKTASSSILPWPSTTRGPEGTRLKC